MELFDLDGGKAMGDALLKKSNVNNCNFISLNRGGKVFWVDANKFTDFESIFGREGGQTRITIMGWSDLIVDENHLEIIAKIAGAQNNSLKKEKKDE